MFGRSKKKRELETFERALEEMVPAAFDISEKWVTFEESLKFKFGVSLTERVRMFSFPVAEFVKSKYPNISNTKPYVYLSTLVLAVYLSRTEPIPEVIQLASDIDRDLGEAVVEPLIRNFIFSIPNR